MRCPNCGQRLSESVVRCPSCGLTFTEDDRLLTEEEETAPKSRPRKKKAGMVMEPESYREKVSASVDGVDEPTRVSGQLPDIGATPDEPTRADLPTVTGEDENVRDYFEEFFNKK